MGPSAKFEKRGERSGGDTMKAVLNQMLVWMGLRAPRRDDFTDRLIDGYGLGHR